MANTPVCYQARFFMALEKNETVDSEYKIS